MTAHARGRLCVVGYIRSKGMACAMDVQARAGRAVPDGEFWICYIQDGELDARRQAHT
ncbi:hypothetical protein LZ31DRAFT_560741 [Colletotrichum somersetense]|nr:hypothetical protein LZ31DRAFT_560741 [Colletotrichum somersetense]